MYVYLAPASSASPDQFRGGVFVNAILQANNIVRLPFQIMRDPETGNSKGFAFINFASFEASDAAMEAMNGQYLCNRPITISYAFKKESKGERHGSAAGMMILMTCTFHNF